MSEIHFDRVPMAMTPLLPEKDDEFLRALAGNLIRKSTQLMGAFNSTTRESIAKLVEPMNSYYSNLIEGHNTHPLDIERALKKDYSHDPQKKLLQLESRAHVMVNRRMKDRLKTTENVNVYDGEFICWLHKNFYDHVPEEFRKIKKEDGSVVDLIPGEYRTTEVKVGRHIAPAADCLENFMPFFASHYNSNTMIDPLKRIIAIAASHHRLAWIHPFLDGNGRVVRLFSEAGFISEKIDGAGLWSISRGLAKNNKQYYELLQNADTIRYGDYDGRGNLSDRFLSDFCKFFLETAIDQVEFMLSLLEPEKVLARLKHFVTVMTVAEEGGMRMESSYVLEEALLRGKVSRGEIPRITGRSENVAREIMNNLLKMELLVSESDALRSPVMINFPIRFAPYIFPKLFPSNVEATMID
jgi:Fic family protein